ncbi:MAG: hypothetical protein GY911_14675 [Actinomycetales bacterium]|nr:hypothetical protein [Actinomycetales bacterium]
MLDSAFVLMSLPVYFGTIDDRMAAHNGAYAGVHALLVPAPKPVKTLPPVLPPYDGPTVHAVVAEASATWTWVFEQRA